MSKRRASKSGSRTKSKAVKPIPSTPATILEDGSKVMHLDGPAADFMEDMYRRFVAKFGREPTEDDPIFFDESSDSDEPQELPEMDFNVMLEVAASQGAPPHVLHAMRRTERIITSPRWFVIPGIPANEHHQAPEEIKQWEDAMQEWHRWQEHAARAEAEGEHPAFVEAIRRSGLRLPRDDEFTLQEGAINATGDTADYFKFIMQYMKDHPDEALALNERLRSLFIKVASPS